MCIVNDYIYLFFYISYKKYSKIMNYNSDYDSIYSIALEILRSIEEGGCGSTTKEWYGTQEEYDAIADKDENTTYFIYE